MPLSTTDPDDRMGRPRLPVQLGSWTVELRGEEIADIAFARVPLLRAIRPVVRDEDWNTVPARIVAQDTVHLSGQLVVTTDLLFDATMIRYRATLTLTVTESDLLVTFAGTALNDFYRNRIGLVVLHPADDAGNSVDVVSASGSTVHGRWPQEISPHQPFTDLVGFRWSKRGVDADLQLSGDVFETEDQRNWTDLSYKTYSTPLALPFPMAVRTGDRVDQRARLAAVQLRQPPSPHQPTPADRFDTSPRPPTRLKPASFETVPGRWQAHVNPDQISVSPTARTEVPALGLGASLYPPPTQPLLGPEGYDAVLVELSGDPAGWPYLLRVAEEQAASLGAGLDVRIVTADPAVLARAIDLLPAGVLRLGAFDPTGNVSTGPLWDALVTATEKVKYPGDLVGGTRAHFTELNRTFHNLADSVPSITFSVTPQMHATELPHLIDSLTGQRLVAHNAARLAHGRPLHVGPVTLAPRFNAVATSGPRDPVSEARTATDPLQSSGFAAAWTLGSIDALSVTGVASICYFETSGQRGIADETGAPYAVKAVLDTVASLRGRHVLESSSPPHLVTYAVQAEDLSIDLLIGNLSPHERSATVQLPESAPIEAVIPRWSTVHLPRN